VTAGQTLARLTLPEGGLQVVQGPSPGHLGRRRRCRRGGLGKGEALFSIIARNEFDLVGLVPTENIAKLAANQAARIKIIGAGEVDGKVRRWRPRSNPTASSARSLSG